MRSITVIVTVSATELTLPSLTSNEKINVPALAGAAKVGCAAAALLSETAGPEICVHT